MSSRVGLPERAWSGGRRAARVLDSQYESVGEPEGKRNAGGVGLRAVAAHWRSRRLLRLFNETSI